MNLMMAEVNNQEIIEYPMVSEAPLLPSRVGVCVGKEQKRGLRALKWALDNHQVIPPNGHVYLLHVKPPLRWIASTMGGKTPIEKASPDLVKRLEEERNLDTKMLALEYVKLCIKSKVTYELCYVKNDSIKREIVDQISKLGITKLILETASQNAITKVLKEKSISAYVAKHAPDFCSVMVVRGNTLHIVKDAERSGLSSFRSRASDVSISPSMSSDEILEDQLITAEGFLVGEDGTSHARLVNSASMDISRGTPEWLKPPCNDSVGLPSPAARVLMRNHSAMPPSRLSEATPAVTLQEESHRGDHWQRPGNDKTPLVTRIKRNTSLAMGHTGKGSPTSASMEDLSGLATSSAANASIHRMMDTSDLESCSDYDALSQISLDLENSAGSSTLEALSSRNSLHELENAPMDLNPTCNTNEALPALDFESMQQQLNEVKQSAQLCARMEVEWQAINFKMAEGIIENAKKKIDEYERKLDAAARIASQNASSYKKELERVGAMVEAAQRDQEILQERLEEEVRMHNVTRNDLETTRRIADASALAVDLAEKELQAERHRYEETILNLDKLRKEAEERASKEATARREAILKLRKEQKYSTYTFQEIQIATDNFSEENKLGQGGYGPVYKGKLHHMTVAIKVLATEGSQGRKEFEKEVELLSHIRHPHLVMLLGACPEHGCIVYDYMANGSLEDRLYCRDNTPPLPWYVRFRICLEVATALLFLHSRPQPVVHRDLKPGNILLDQHFVSKISDVGVAKLVPNNVTFNTTIYYETVLVGTSLYIDPEYLQTGVVTCESDVYALGIVMLQLLTGQKPMGVIDLVEDALDCGRVEDVLDKVAGEWPLVEASALAHLSLQCADPKRKRRPNLETKILPELEHLQRVADMAAASVAYAGPSSSDRMNIIPGSFFCPISQEIMENPHIAADGFTYEHDAIKLWLETNNTSPMTNLELSHKSLIPNLAVRSAIKEWHYNGLLLA